MRNNSDPRAKCPDFSIFCSFAGCQESTEDGEHGCWWQRLLTPTGSVRTSPIGLRATDTAMLKEVTECRELPAAVDLAPLFHLSSKCWPRWLICGPWNATCYEFEDNRRTPARWSRSRSTRRNDAI